MYSAAADARRGLGEGWTAVRRATQWLHVVRERAISTEPTTLVQFRLDDAGGATRLTIVESGFDGIPAARRAEATDDDEGWTEQTRNISRHVAEP